jgi:hypothetical protein
MTPDTLAKAVSATLGFEGRIAWLYRDDTPEGYATAGAGHACFTQADALLLPWQVAGQPATPQQIAADYQAVMAAPLGHTAGYYEPLTVCRLADADVVGLCGHDLTVGWATFLTHFPQADLYPDGAQLACCDLIVNLGPNWPVNGKWPHLAAAVLANDWATAAAQSHRAPPISAARNAYVAQQFQLAAQA